mgnify:CR=1 FL=1
MVGTIRSIVGESLRVCIVLRKLNGRLQYVQRWAVSNNAFAISSLPMVKTTSLHRALLFAHPNAFSLHNETGSRTRFSRYRLLLNADLHSLQQEYRPTGRSILREKLLAGLTILHFEHSFAVGLLAVLIEVLYLRICGLSRGTE